MLYCIGYVFFYLLKQKVIAPSSDYNWSSARVSHLSQLLDFALTFDAERQRACTMPNDLSILIMLDQKGEVLALDNRLELTLWISQPRPMMHGQIYIYIY